MKRYTEFLFVAVLFAGFFCLQLLEEYMQIPMGKSKTQHQVYHKKRIQAIC